MRENTGNIFGQEDIFGLFGDSFDAPQNDEISVPDEKEGKPSTEDRKDAQGAKIEPTEDAEVKADGVVPSSNTDSDFIFIMTEFKELSCPYCKKIPSIRSNITDKKPMEDPERYRIVCCQFSANGISETQVIYNWNNQVLKAMRKLRGR